MQTVHKYHLDFTVSTIEILMPKKARILYGAKQEEGLVIWASVDTEEDAVIRRFRIYGTGWAMEEPMESLVHISTIKDGILVWHLFEVKDSTKARGDNNDKG